MRKATSAAAMAAIVMTGFVPAGLIVSRVTSQSFAQLLCRGALGSEWTDSGAAACSRPVGQRTFH